MTELSRRLSALRDAGQAACLLLRVFFLGAVALYVATSPITLTVMLAAMFFKRGMCG